MRQLHAKAVATGERDLLFALAELSYLAGDHFSRSVNAPIARDPRDYYLGAAVYAWLFLFGEGTDRSPDAFDRRFRTACDLYNYGWAWRSPKTETTPAWFAWRPPGGGCRWVKSICRSTPRDWRSRSQQLRTDPAGRPVSRARV